MLQVKRALNKFIYLKHDEAVDGVHASDACLDVLTDRDLMVVETLRTQETVSDCDHGHAVEPIDLFDSDLRESLALLKRLVLLSDLDAFVVLVFVLLF